MRIVLDTNVLVGGLRSPYHRPARVLGLLLSKAARLCYDPRTLSEYREVLLRPKFAFPPDRVGAVIDFLEQSGELVTAKPWQLALPHPDDAVFLEVAAAAQADHLVTGNLRHFPVRSRGGISVVSPAELLSSTDFQSG